MVISISALLLQDERHYNWLVHQVIKSHGTFVAGDPIGSFIRDDARQGENTITEGCCFYGKQNEKAGLRLDGTTMYRHQSTEE